MKKLQELLGLRHCKGDIGVEIECEGKNLNLIDSITWRTERDGSLRGEYPTNSSEYVMRQPVVAKNLPLALSELIEHQKDATLNFSFRTSVHVHINVLGLTEDELLAFIYACLLLEEPLMNFCGEERKGNRFCLRVGDAEGYDKALNMMFREGARGIHTLRGDAIRYSAINLHSLSKYGSVEFRGMRGNMDPEILLPWCSALLSIRSNAKKLGNPINVYNMYVGMSNQDFLKKMIGKHHSLFTYAGVEQDMDRSFSLNISLPHLFLQKKKEPAKPPGVFVVKKVKVAPKQPQVGYVGPSWLTCLATNKLVLGELEAVFTADGFNALPLDSQIRQYIHTYKKVLV